MAAISYKYRGVELNDGVNYSVPLADQTLDDPNSATATWVTRKGAVPVQTNHEIKEAVFTLNLYVVRAAGETGTQYQTKIEALKALFNTRDPAFYQLERKLPHEQYYRYIEAAPREVTINRLERRVSVTFQCADKTWRNSTQYTDNITLFETAARTEDLSITYGGNYPAEPTITIKALTPGTDGPVPLYYRDVTVYSAGTGQGGWVVGNPVLVATGWNTNTEVGAGKLRADGLDITVTLADGTPLRRYIGGTQAARKVWVLPHTWPSFAAATLVDGSGVGAPNDPPAAHRSLLAADTSAYINVYAVETLPASGKISLDSEIIAYSGATILSQTSYLTQVLLTGLTRGADSTVAADHYRYARVKRPTVLRVSYGYAAGYTQIIYNDLNGWPLIDYETSTNGEWVQTDTFDLNPTNRPWVWRRDTDPTPLRAGESVIAWMEDTQHSAIYGQYETGGPNSTVHQRLLLPAPAVAARELTHIRLVMTLKGGQAGYPAITVRLMRQSTTGGVFELWSYTHNSAAELQVDTGYLAAEAGMMSPVANYYIRLDNAAPGGQVRNVRLDAFYAKLDQNAANYPVFTTLGAEQGLGLGLYPATLTIQNVTDTGNPQTFRVYTRLTNNQSVVLNAAEHSVTGMLLSECTYTNPVWLRLLKGANTIRFTGTQGTGQMLVTVDWRERY